MQLEYDLNVGALYIRLSDQAVAVTRAFGDNAAVDTDRNGHVVGIEVISAGHPWPLGEILITYKIPDDELAQIHAYFGPLRFEGDPLQPAPEISIASPAPAMAASAA